MAFTSLSTSLIDVGKAIKKEIFTTLRSNQEDLNTRLTSIEAGGNKIRFFNGTVLNGASYSTATGLLFHRVESTYSITDIKVILYDKGSISSGTLQIDIQKSSSPDFTSSVSVLTTRPSLDLSVASSYTESTNAVLDAGEIELSEGDYLRLDVTSLPSGLGYFGFYVIGEPT